MEEQFYLAFPLLVILSCSTKRLSLSLFAIIIVGLIARYLVLAGTPILAFYNSFCCFDVLALGVLCAVHGERLRLNRGIAITVTAVAGCCLIAVLMMGAQQTLAPAVAAIAASTVLAAQTGRVFSGQMWLPIAWIGRLSYGIYLLHPFVLYALSPVLRGLPFLVGYCVFAVAAILAAALSQVALERPAANWIHRQFMPPPIPLRQFDAHGGTPVVKG